jgi:hypothetical protein
MQIQARNGGRGTWLEALGAVVGLAIVGALPASAEVASYPSAEAAVEAFRAALAQDDDGNGLVELFGTENRAQILGGDPAAARRVLAGLREDARVALQLAPRAEGGKALLIGAQAWPLPFPLVESGGSWSFDVAAGLDEIVNRRIGRNELAAIDLCRAYSEAQVEYSSADRDDDEVLEYATRIESTPGKHDGLHWKDATADDPSPLGDFAAAAEDYLEFRKQGEPYYGYRFRVLNAQGAGAPGGRYGYVINGNMIAGFALVAWPVEPGNSGIMTFIVSQTGRIYQKDLGDKTLETVAAMKEYDPSGWTEVAGD